MLRPIPLLASAVTLGATLAAQVPQAGETFQVPGTDATVRIWTDQGVTKSAVSRDGGASWVDQRAPRHELSFRRMKFDPAAGAPSVPPQLMAANDSQLFYVQFRTDIIAEYRTALERMGVEVLYHFPYQSFIVRMPRGSVSNVQREGFVRAVADMHPAYKLEQTVIADVLGGGSKVQTYDIMLANKHLDAPAVEKAVGDVGGELLGRANGSILVTANLTPAQARTMAGRNDVIWIEPLGPAELDIDNLRAVAGVDTVVSMLGGEEFGKGMAGHVLEGVHSSHCEFTARPPWRVAPIAALVNGTGSASSGHGTNTAGEIYAEGKRPDAKGILPWAQMYYTNYNNTVYNTNERYPQTQELTDPNDNKLVSFQTASWGYSRTTDYTSRSAEMDDILFDFDLLVTNSQSNSGSTPSRPQAWAKNVIGVGGFNHYNNVDPSDDCHCFTGSTGPAADGRVGVTFASFYDSILTTSGGSCSYSTSFGGTSGATPTVNGLAAVTIQLFTDGTWGHPSADVSDPATARANRFALRPHYTTTRALMATGTDQVDMFSASRYEQGWGRPNVATIYNDRDHILVVNEEDVVTQGQTQNYLVYVAPGTPELRASIHWSEDEAVPSANPTAHNDLNLTVTDPSGNVWWGNRGGLLDSHYNTFSGTAPPSGAADPGPNDRDIHENVLLRIRHVLRPGHGPAVRAVSAALHLPADSVRSVVPVLRALSVHRPVRQHRAPRGHVGRWRRLRPRLARRRPECRVRRRAAAVVRVRDAMSCKHLASGGTCNDGRFVGLVALQCRTCPGYDGPVRGAGDVVAKITRAVGIPTCPGCHERRVGLNEILPNPRR